MAQTNQESSDVAVRLVARTCALQSQQDRVLDLMYTLEQELAALQQAGHDWRITGEVAQEQHKESAFANHMALGFLQRHIQLRLHSERLKEKLHILGQTELPAIETMAAELSQAANQKDHHG